MTKVTGLLALLAAGALASCSKAPAPPEAPPPPPPGKSAEAATQAPQGPAQKAEKLKMLIAPRPECQGFLTELDDMGRSPMATNDKLNEIVAKAGAAGCTQAPNAP